MTAAERAKASRAACVSVTSLARSATSLMETTREPSGVTPTVTIAGKRLPPLRASTTSNSPRPCAHDLATRRPQLVRLLGGPVRTGRRAPTSSASENPVISQHPLVDAHDAAVRARRSTSASCSAPTTASETCHALSDIAARASARGDASAQRRREPVDDAAHEREPRRRTPAAGPTPSTAVPASQPSVRAASGIALAATVAATLATTYGPGSESALQQTDVKSSGSSDLAVPAHRERRDSQRERNRDGQHAPAARSRHAEIQIRDLRAPRGGTRVPARPGGPPRRRG